jgi:hypothetical protein
MAVGRNPERAVLVRQLGIVRWPRLLLLQLRWIARRHSAHRATRTQFGRFRRIDIGESLHGTAPDDRQQKKRTYSSHSHVAAFIKFRPSDQAEKPLETRRLKNSPV